MQTISDRSLDAGEEEGASPEGLLFRELIELMARAVFAEAGARVSLFYREVCRLTASAVGASGAALFFAESNGEAVISVAVHDAARVRHPGRRFRRGEGLAGAAMEHGRLEVYDAARPNPAFIAAPEIRSVAAVPFNLDEEPVSGCLCLHNPENDLFTPSALALLERLGAPLASIFRIVRYADQVNESNRRLRESAERSAVLYTLATLVGDRQPLEEILDEAIDAVMRLFRIDQAAVYLLDGDALRVEAGRGLSGRFEVGTRIDFGGAAAGGQAVPPAPRRAIFGGAAAGGQAVPPAPRRAIFGGAVEGEALVRGEDRLRDLVRRAAQSGRAQTFEGESHRGGLLRGRIPPAGAFPLEIGGQRIGVLLLARGFEDERPIDEAESSRIAAFVGHLALLIDQARSNQDRSQEEAP